MKIGEIKAYIYEKNKNYNEMVKVIKDLPVIE